MNAPAADWTDVKALFAACLDAAPEARAALLHAASVDTAVRAEVEALLAAMDAASPLEGGAADYAAPLFADEEGMPDAIGPYRPRARIGRGGMGTVYLAERELDGATQRVALKVIRRGLDSPELRQRFRRERLILARLQHDRIARLIDAGVDAEGRPWFALEYVDGQPLSGWCDARRLPVRARIERFLDVLDAVGYAHRNLVVHRDLKPGNVLVTGEGGVKLLDFGIAKLLEDEGDEATALTRTAAPMTLAYAAPEQLLGGAVTTATDIYALGVLLYELLCGRLPHARAGRSRIVAAIGDDDTERLARALRRDAAAPDAHVLAAARSDSVAGLVRAFDRDLDQIVRTALAKAPEQRYASADAFAADLKAWLDGRPLLSAPTSLRQRVTKYLRRHRLGVAATALVLLTALAGVAATVWQAQVAQHHAHMAGRVREFLVGMLDKATPEQAQGKVLTMREVLDSATARIGKDLAGESELQALLYSDIGEMYVNLGEHELAQAVLTNALRLAERDPAIRAVDRGIIEARLAQEYYEAEKPEDAKALAHTAQARLDASHAPLRKRIDTRLILAIAYADLGDEATALAYAQEANRMLETDQDADDDMRADVYGILALRYNVRGEFRTAADWQRRGIELNTRLYGPDHTSVLTDRQNLATMLHQAGADYAEAETLLRDVWERRRRILGPTHPHTINAEKELAWNLGAQGRYAESLARYDEVLAWFAKQETDDPGSRAVALNGRGSAHLLVGAWAAAAADFEAATQLFTARYGATHEYTYAAQSNLAQAWAWQGRMADARTLIEAVVAARKASGSSRLGQSLNARGIVLARAGATDAALVDLDDALERAATRTANDPLSLAPIRIEIAALKAQLGDAATARSLLDRANGDLARRYPTGNPRIARADEVLADLALARKDASAARTLLAEALRMREAACAECEATRAVRERIAALK